MNSSTVLRGLRPLPVAACLSAAVLAGLPALTQAHDFWVEPAVFLPAPGELVDVRLREGVGFRGDTLPYIDDWFRDFSTVSAEDGRQRVESLQGNDPAATVRAPAGALLIGYESQRSFTTLDAAKFNAYLDEEGIEYIRAERIAAGTDDEPAPEYFVRCAKALIQAGAAGPDDTIWQTRLGYRLELVPEQNPYLSTATDTLTFRLWLRDGPAVGLLLQAFTRDEPERVQQIRTDADGRATIELHSAGVWLVKAVHIEPIVGSPYADWLSHWASFLFEVPATPLTAGE